MPPVLEPAGKKQKTVRVFATDQKLWLIELCDKNPSFKHLRLAQEFKVNFYPEILVVISCPA